MSSDKAWHTKQDVLKDLARASGRRVAVGDLDSRHIVTGNNPPPVRYEAQDEEMRLLYGDNDIYAAGDIYGETEPPDLEAISAMLHLVKQQDRERREAQGFHDEIDLSMFGQPSNCVIAISKGSTLNPDVKEFIPKGASSSPSSSDLSEKCSTSVEKTDDSAAENAETIDNFKVESAKTVDVDLATRLRNEISDASKCNTFEIKQQRNVAISTLLRLYAPRDKSPPKEKEKEPAPLKLITPDYFENASSPVTDEPKKENKTPTPPSTQKKISTPHSTTMSPRPSTSTSSSIEVKSEPALPTQAKSPKSQLDPMVKKSIEKVNNWLGGEPTVRKPPPVFLGPVSFKRRTPAAVQSTPTERTVEPETPAAAGRIQQYQPSAYAAELHKKYKERSKAEKDKQKRNMWTDLDIILKEKDEAKKRPERAEDEDKVA